MNERGKAQDPGEEALRQRGKRLFDESVQALDAETVSRLNRGRRRALAEANRNGAELRWLRLTPAAAAAAALAAAVIVWQLQSGIDELPPDTAADFELLFADEDFEMLEDLEFYRWMALDETVDDAGPDDHVG
ncbi:MAG: hypothetical protein ACREQ8_09715 [Woeseiaceae bacterium]